MNRVVKYNVCKALSIILTVSAPIITLLTNADLFIHESNSSISMVGFVAIIFSVLFFKDKLLENIKVPSPFIISAIGLVFIILVESIIKPMKLIFFVTVIVTGIDTLTFKRIYKNIEKEFPDNFCKYQKFGFITVKNKDLFGE